MEITIILNSVAGNHAYFKIHGSKFESNIRCISYGVECTREHVSGGLTIRSFLGYSHKLYRVTLTFTKSAPHRNLIFTIVLRKLYYNSKYT